jgi:hypothetical protein
MGDRKNKASFSWESGTVLDDKVYDAIGGIKSKGLTKIGKALAADPERRHKERESFVLKEQVKPYAKKEPAKEDPLIIEESVSGLSNDFEDEKARQLLDAGKNTKIKGLGQFGKK